tara:strand:- start:20847 stop:21866 length:1020 start_codon:yes stop_codon:yes gene_type:complete
MDKKVFIVAELSANHMNNKAVIIDTIKAAKNSGADAFKIQTFDLNQMTLNTKDERYVIKKGIWKGYNHFELYKKIHLPWEWHEFIFEECYKQDLLCFSSPFDLKSAKFLENLNNPIYKIASSEVNHIPLIELVTKLKKPVIFSTGAALENDIRLFIDTARKNKNKDITVLQCTAKYPSKVEDANLNNMTKIRDNYQVKVGLSDHTTSNLTSIIATSLGAQVIEKHFKLNNKIDSPDSFFSLIPKAFESLVQDIRATEKAIKLKVHDEKTLFDARQNLRSIFAINNIKKGEVFSEKNLSVMRPNLGIHPKYFEKLIGEIVPFDISKHTPINEKVLKSINK